jgi:hypothetical protein
VKAALVTFAAAAAILVAASLPSSSIHFTDVTPSSGIKFKHNSGKAGKKFLPETLGAGVAFFDDDNDGWPDILLINGKDWTPRGRRTFHALYHNNHNGSFSDVTAGSGLEVEMYGMGVAIGDYDNDGRDDVYIIALEGDRLFHNEGNGKFRDVTDTTGIRNASFGTSAAWLDYDRDGKLDLFVANYVQWTPKADLWCCLDGSTKSYCTPESYQGTSSKLYHNLGGGQFEDVSVKAGVADPTSKSLGMTVLDFDNDGWPDIFVANDTQPNKLYHNTGKGTFTEEGMTAGVAFGEDGVPGGPWVLIQAIMIAPAGLIFWSAIFPTRCWGFTTIREVDCSWTKLLAPRSGAPACLAWLSAFSFSTTTWTASWISLLRTVTSKKKLVECSPRFNTDSPLCFFATLATASLRT